MSVSKQISDTLITLLQNPDENIRLRLKIIDSLTKRMLATTNNKIISKFNERITRLEGSDKEVQEDLNDLFDSVAYVEDRVNLMEDLIVEKKNKIDPEGSEDETEGCDCNDCCCEYTITLKFNKNSQDKHKNRLSQNHRYEVMYDYLENNIKNLSEKNAKETFLKALKYWNKYTSILNKVHSQLIFKLLTRTDETFPLINNALEEPYASNNWRTTGWNPFDTDIWAVHGDIEKGFNNDIWVVPIREPEPVRVPELLESVQEQEQEQDQNQDDQSSLTSIESDWDSHEREREQTQLKPDPTDPFYSFFPNFLKKKSD